MRVDVDDPASLAAAVGDTDVVLNATYMRHNVPVTDAAIAAGVHLVDLGSYYPETLQQLDRHEAAERAGCRIVPGCGVAPGLTNILARLGADRLDTVQAIRALLVHHPSAVDVARDRRDPLRCEHRHVGRLGARRARRAAVVRRRRAVRASPSRMASRRSTSSPTPSR